MMKSAFELQFEGYGLTTAQILYHLPDHPHLLQSFIWQEYDLEPDFPVLFNFIDFWKEEIEGPIHSIVYAHKRLIGPNEWRNVNGEIVLH
ncbi:usg protein [Phyllobacterium phragmitis]